MTEGLGCSSQNVNGSVHPPDVIQLLLCRSDVPEDWRLRIATMADSSDTAIIGTDLNGIIQGWSVGAECIFGYKAQEVLGHHVSALVPAELANEISVLTSRVVQGESVSEYRTQWETKDGRTLWVSVALFPIRDHRGGISRVLQAAHQIGGHSHFPDHLQSHLAAIVESSDDAIISKDLNGIIQSWNRGAQRIFGYTAEETIGRHVSMLAAPGHADEIPAILDRIASGERVEHYLTKRKTKDGRILSISLTVSPIRDANGVIVGASKVARDVTEYEKTQEALRVANTLLKQSNADLQQFAYSASHDLQEPLRTITAYAQLMDRKFAGQLGALGNRYLHYVIDAAATMEYLLASLRTYAQAASAEPGVGPADANKALRQAMISLRAALEENNAVVTFEDLPCIRLEEFHLQQVLQNLIGNSIRYRSKKPPRIHITAKRVGDMWLFSVRDNGIGIDPQYKEEIFGLFKRLHSVAEHPGSGMGLAICQRIIERAGGKIWVESRVGEGATFFFTIPGRDE